MTEVSWVKTLLKVKAPKVLISLVLLLSWNSQLGNSSEHSYQFFEIFAGQGRVSAKMHSMGYKVASFDYDYSSKHMDFLGAPGFLLCLHTIMYMDERSLSLWAPDCGSWGIPCRGTSMRSLINPCGFTGFGFVARANVMVSRMVLALLLVVSRCLFFLVEQPSQSLLCRHPRVDWFFNRVAWVFSVHFWMLHHGAESSKRSVFYGNLSTMMGLDKGKLSRAEREKKTTRKTTRKYIDKSGKARFVGDKVELKKSQAYPGGLADTIHQLYFDELNRPVRGDLRFDNTPSKLKTDLELFRDLPLGDHWPDADLLPCFQYLYSCKYTRIPSEWKPVMAAFHRDLVKAHQ